MTAALFDEGAVPLGSNDRTESQSTSESTRARRSLTLPVHHNAPPGTSDVAADRIASRAGTLRAAVLTMLRERGEHGATDQEMQDALQLPSNTQLPRRWELMNAGAVVASGRKRKTRSGCPAIVWVRSEFAPKPEGGTP